LAPLNYTLLAGLGILLGVSLAAPPGPVTSVMLQRATRSVLGGAMVGFGAMSADFVLMLITLTAGFEIRFGQYVRILFLVGAIFFFYLAYSIVRAGSRLPAKETPDEIGNIHKSGYLIGLTIGLVNPMQIGWWITAGLGMYKQFGIVPMIFIFVGILIWIFFLSEIIWRLSKKYEKAIYRGVRIFSFLSLSAFGVIFMLSFAGINFGF